MTELLEAVADASVEAREQRTLRVAAALYEADKAGVKQSELVRDTGYNRETIRRHIEDEKIRRGEIEPTRRYLDEQEKRRKRAVREDGAPSEVRRTLEQMGTEVRDRLGLSEHPKYDPGS